MELTAVLQMALIDPLGCLRLHNVQLTSQRVEILVEVRVGVQFSKLLAVLDVFEVKEDLVPPEKDRHLFLQQPKPDMVKSANYMDGCALLRKPITHRSSVFEKIFLISTGSLSMIAHRTASR